MNSELSENKIKLIGVLMNENIKDFFVEHSLTMISLLSCGILATGKLAFGWSIGWGWVFAPFWIPLAAVVGLSLLTLAAIMMVMAIVVGMSIGVAINDKEFFKTVQESVDEAVENEDGPVDFQKGKEESETLQ